MHASTYANLVIINDARTLEPHLRDRASGRGVHHHGTHTLECTEGHAESHDRGWRCGISPADAELSAHCYLQIIFTKTPH